MFAILIMAILLGAIVGVIAQSKGRSFPGWWFYGSCIFIIAIIHVLLIRPTDRELVRRERKRNDIARKARSVLVDPDHQASSATQIDALERLAALLERGVITQEEFEDHKAKLLRSLAA